ncbi:MAG: hypothetical protein QXZ22_09050 [Sulfolobales archaeon]
MPDSTCKPSTGPASTARVKVGGFIGPLGDWKLYLPVVRRALEADVAVFRHEGGARATIIIEKLTNGWRVKPANATIPGEQREGLEKLLALLLHPNKWRFTLELEINTCTPQT